MAVCGAAVLHTVIGVTFMNRSYKSIPKTLVNKVIAFIGTFPGVGKSYTKNELLNQLINEGYRVYNTGTTQKASIGGTTVAAQSLDRRNNWTIKSKHTRTNGFYLIDEAFMMDQAKLDELRDAYPNCCFILFGDPMQFEPASGNAPITKLDLIINLNKMMRCKDSDLIDALKMIKNGDLPVEFMMKHCDNNIDDSMLVIGYTKAMSIDYSNQFKDIPGVTLYRSMKREEYTDEYGDKQYSVLNDVYNGDLWRLLSIEKRADLNYYTLERISGYSKVITINEDKFRIHFEKKNCINNHKIQGDTIRKGTDVIVWIDEMIVNFPQSVLRHLYVAFSRVEYSSQIHMTSEQVSDLIINYKKCGPLINYLSFNAPNQRVVETSSSEICSMNILKFIQDNLPVIQEYNQGNVQLIPSYKKQLSANLLNIGNGNLDTQNRIKVYADRVKSMKLQKELDNRLLQDIPGKGKCFITINDTMNGEHKAGAETEYNWFVFEIDEIDGKKVTPEEIKRYFIGDNNNLPKYSEAKKSAFRIIYSGNKSYHFWIYVDNEELNKCRSRELYKAVHNYLNEKLFNGWADKSISTPEHLVRAPGVIRPETNKEQKLISFKGKKVLHIDDIMSFLKKDEPVVKQEITTKNGSVEQAFNMYKDDIPTTNGGRGQKILSKLYKEFYRGFLDKYQLKELANMLCAYANCMEKISKMHSYIDEM